MLTFTRDSTTLKVMVPGHVQELVGVSALPKLLSHLGRHGAIQHAKQAGVFRSLEDQEVFEQALHALPLKWPVMLTGAQVQLHECGKVVQSRLTGFGATRYCETSEGEGAITDETGNMLVLLQTENHLGIAASQRSEQTVTLCVARSEHVPTVAGALIESSQGEEISCYTNDPEEGHEKTTWNFQYEDMARVFLIQFGARLDDSAYCSKAGLRRFQILRPGMLKVKGTRLTF